MAAFSANEQYAPGFTAENSFSGKIGYLAELGGSAGQVDVCDGATDLVIGVICNEPAAGGEVLLQVGGIAKVIAGGSISAGARVGTTNAGKAVTKSSDADLTCGIALSAADDGDFLPVLLCPGTQRAS